MPIALHPFTAFGASHQPGYYIACELARQCVDQYHLNIMPGAGGGIANASCWAALTIVPNFNWHAPRAVNAAGAPGVGLAVLPYAMAFGVSQMAMVNALVPVPGFAGGGHAERVALIAAGAGGCALYPIGGVANTAVLFVQLEPCPPCAAWLVGGGGGVANPFAAALGGATTVPVWYRWPYPGGRGSYECPERHHARCQARRHQYKLVAVSKYACAVSPRDQPSVARRRRLPCTRCARMRNPAIVLC